jgi:hypothetical protein
MKQRSASSTLTSLLLLASLPACQLSLTPSIGPTIDTQGEAGFETRADFAWALGGDHGRFMQSAGAGFGYHQDIGPHAVVTTSFGVELDYHREAVPALVDFTWGPTFLFNDEGWASVGGGIVTDFMLFTEESKDAEQLLFFGPRLELRGVSTQYENGTRDSRGRLFLGPAMHWRFYGSPLPKRAKNQ